MAPISEKVLDKKLRTLVQARWEHGGTESKLRTQGDQVLAKLKALHERSDPKVFVAMCEDMGALNEAAAGGAFEALRWLLDLGVSTSAPTRHARDNDLFDPDVIATLVLSEGVEARVIVELIQRVLDAGHDVNAPAGQAALVEIAGKGAWELAEPVLAAANPATRATALATLIRAAAAPGALDAGTLARLDDALERIDPNVSDGVGLTPLHMAAATGRIAVWERVAPRVHEREPRLRDEAMWAVRGFGFTQLSPGSTPLDVVRTARELYAADVPRREEADALAVQIEAQLAEPAR